ncbi:MAG: hypothetical protein IPI67_14335 [Myxococcales bacterium]|nr:hypothetical protein [Myxococcales bacterium]
MKRRRSAALSSRARVSSHCIRDSERQIFEAEHALLQLAGEQLLRQLPEQLVLEAEHGLPREPDQALECGKDLVPSPRIPRPLLLEVRAHERGEQPLHVGGKMADGRIVLDDGRACAFQQQSQGGTAAKVRLECVLLYKSKPIEGRQVPQHLAPRLFDLSGSARRRRRRRDPDARVAPRL